jgi:hypothetical protein
LERLLNSKGVFKKTKKKYYFVILLLVLAIFLSGCSGGGIVTPNTDEVVCENLLRALYTALNDRNFTQALSYCKSGGLTFEYVNNLWNWAQVIPTFYVTYQVYDVYDVSYLVGGNLELYYNYSWATNIKSYFYGRRMVFEKIKGEWKMF